MSTFFALLPHKITSPALSNLFRNNAYGELQTTKKFYHQNGMENIQLKARSYISGKNHERVLIQRFV